MGQADSRTDGRRTVTYTVPHSMRAASVIRLVHGLGALMGWVELGHILLETPWVQVRFGWIVI